LILSGQSTLVRLVLPLVLAAMSCGVGHAARADKIDDYVRTVMQKQHIPGISVAIVQDGKVERAKGYGMANVELSVPASENTAYQLASVTKQFTATAILMLVEEGKLSLDDPVTKILPDLPTAWEKVTLRHLLSHTSGIKNYTSTKDFDKTMRKDFTQREILDLVAKEPLEFAPGEKWNYSNTGFFLLGMVIEKVTGKSYGAFLEERIFQPLGMMHTRVNDLNVILPNRAHGYSWNGKELRNGEYVSPTQPFAAGALISTVSDMVKWDAALRTEKLVKKSTLDQMWTPAPLAKGQTANYGFGWQVERVNGHRLISHGGGIPGFSTQISRFVDDKLTVIVLTNSDSGNAGGLARGIAGRVLPALAKQAEAPIPDPEPQTTGRLKDMLQKAMKGDPDLELFTPEFQKVRTAHIEEEKERLADFGALKTFQLMERKPTDEGVQLRYRATFANQTLQLFFLINKAGKIAGVGMQPED